MKRVFHTLVLLALFSIVIFDGPFSAAAAGTSTSSPVRVVVVSGSNNEMGVQYGEQAADLIAATRDAVWNALDTQVVDNNNVPLGRDAILKDIQVWTYYLEKYDPQLKDWLLGISKGCANKGFTVSYSDLVANMVHPQEIWARPQMPYPAETGVTAFLPSKKSTLLAKGRTSTQPVASCTSFAATGNATKGSVPMVSITGTGVPQVQIYLILVAFPTGGEPFIALTDAGRVGTNFGMNSKYGWTMPAAVTDPTQACASSWGVTSEVYFHYLLQYCKSPMDAMTYLLETPKGGVTGNFLFADSSGDVFAFETGSCDSVIRPPGAVGENKDFVASTNDYNSPAMAPFNLPAAWFPDTHVRYATIFNKLSSAPSGTIGLDFAKAAWLSNNWYDVTTNTWKTVPVPDDPNDPNICNVPGNLCEGGEYEMIAFPAQRTAYLEYGDPQGTTVTNYWPNSPNPAPTGEYTKWQLRDSINQTASFASSDAQQMFETASASFRKKAGALDPATRQSLKDLLTQASEALSAGKRKGQSAGYTPGNKEAQMALWGAAYTNYATAQLYSQMVSTQLKQH